ncbi:MAG: stalk domain-containing protein [Bacillota bacterium]
MKKQSFFLLILTLVFFTTLSPGKPCLANTNIRVEVDGEQLQITGTKPYLENDRVLIPMRAILEKLNAKVYWNEATQTVTAQLDNNNIELTINELKARKNDQEIQLETSPKLIEGKTMIPLRFVAEALGSKVNWDAEKNAVEISRPGVKKLQLDWEWQFKSDLDFNFLVAETDDTLLVFGDDGLLSGHNEHTALYGIDKVTGKKIWQMNADKSFPMMVRDFVISADQKYLTVMIKSESKLVCLETATGEVVWKKNIEIDEAYLNELSGAEGVIAYTVANPSKQNFLYVLDENTGEMLWAKQFTAKENFSGDHLLADNYSYPTLLLATDQNITALDPQTGETRWELPGKSLSRNFYSLPFTALKEDFRYFNHLKEETKWIIKEDKLVKMDLAKGEILNKVDFSEKNFISILDEQYLLIKKYDLGEYEVFGKNLKDKDFTTSLYDLEKDKTIWEMEGRGSLAVIEEGIIYLLIGGYGGYPAAFELDTGNKLWQSPHKIGDIKNLLVWENYLLVPDKESLHFLDKETGELLYWLADTQIKEAEARGPLNTYGLVTKIGDKLYVGSSDGSFQVYSKNKE